MADTYQCGMCGGVFEYCRPHDEALVELEQNFPGCNVADCGIICDDCYQETGLFCGPPQDPFKDIPKHLREVFRAHHDMVAARVAKAFEDHILYGTPLSENVH